MSQPYDPRRGPPPRAPSGGMVRGAPVRAPSQPPPEPEDLDLSQFLVEDPEPLSASALQALEDPEVLDPDALLEPEHLQPLEPLSDGALLELPEAGTDPGHAALDPLPDYSQYEVIEGLEQTRLDADGPPLRKRKGDAQEAEARRRRGPERPFVPTSCPSCATELPQPAPAFCEACGMRLVKPGKKREVEIKSAGARCSECGVNNRPGAQRCAACGARLSTD